MATQVNLKMFENTSDSLTVEIKENDAYLDLNGDTFYFTVKEDFSDADSEAIIKKDVVIASGTGTKEAVISLAPADTKGKTGLYKYQIAWLPHGGGREVLYFGAFQLDPQVRSA